MICMRSGSIKITLKVLGDSLKDQFLLESMSATISILVAFTLVSLCSCSNESCPTWLYHSEEGWCSCGSSLHGDIICNNFTQEVSIFRSLCLTNFNTHQSPPQEVVGSCLYAQGRFHHLWKDNIGVAYASVNPNISKQDEQLCGYLNREGRLCGECFPNHFVSPYSYDLKCNYCHIGLWRNILLYVTVAYLPLTVFLVIILVFRISVTSPKLNVVVLICQIYTSPQTVRVLIQNTRQTPVAVFCQIVSAMYGIWNLDFFRALTPPLCLPLTTMQVFALDYLVAVYPLFLLVCFYVLVTAHDRGWRPIVRLWRPFLRCTTQIRQRWNVRHSIIDAFATFILLSYMKFVNTSIDLLIPTEIADIHGSVVGYFWYYDATVDYLGAEHIPYFVLAVVVLVLGIMFPLMLILYPMKWFQNTLNRCHLNSPALRVFMECFQGNFRDRADGGWECRYFSAVYPSFRIGESIVYSLTRSNVFFQLMTLGIVLTTACILVYRPYKKQWSHYNNVDTLLLMSLLGFSTGTILYKLHGYDWLVFPGVMGIILATTFGLVPLIYILTVLVRKQRMWCLTCYRNYRRRSNSLSALQPLLEPPNNK